MGRYADAVTQILLEQGRARAQGQLASGQAWGQAAQQLGQIPGQVIAQQQQLQEFQQKRLLNEQAIASNKALEQQRLEEVATQQRAAKNQQILDGLYQNAFVKDDESGVYTFKPDLVIQGLAGTPNAHLIPQTLKDLEALTTTMEGGVAKRRAAVAQGLYNITSAGNTNESALTNLAALKQNHLIPEDRYQAMLDQLAQDGSPDAVKALVERVGGALPEYRQLVTTEAERVAKLKKLEAETAALAPKPIEVSPGGTLVNPVTNAPVFTAPPKPAEHSPIYKEWQDYTATGGTKSFNDYMTEDANRKKSVVNVSGLSGLYNQTDPAVIAAGIRRGEMPPDISQYGRPVQGAIASLLAKPGPNQEAPFNLANAQRIWASQKRLNATMNGAQQVRLDESIKSGLAMYDRVDEIADRWQGMGLGALSRANLKIAMEGGKGQEAAKIANELTGQIGQLTSDIATIEQGGLTPTNEARKVAEQSMQNWWGTGTIKAMTAQGRANMRIRETARADQTPFVGGNTGPQGQPLPALPPPPVTAAKVGDVVTVQGKRIKITALHPDGTFDGTQVP